MSEHADPTAPLTAPTALVSVEEILIMVAADLSGSSGEMRIQKRPVHAQLAIPPFLIGGTIHVPMESRPVDGLLLGTDQFIAMTDATVASGTHPELGRTAPVLALRRGRAHVLLIADDDEADEPASEAPGEAPGEEGG